MIRLPSRLQRKIKKSSDQGAVLVEFALLAPVLIMLALGVLEYGNAWHQTTSIERAVQMGGRSASAGGNGRFADFEALRAVDAVTRGLPGIKVDSVVIYNATGTDGTVPDNCRAASLSNLCNFYSGDQVRTTTPVGFTGGTSANPACSSSSWDRAWCPVSRPREEYNQTRIGVHVTATYKSVTNLLPVTVQIERYAVYEIEPCAVGHSRC